MSKITFPTRFLHVKDILIKVNKSDFNFQKKHVPVFLVTSKRKK